MCIQSLRETLARNKVKNIKNNFSYLVISCYNKRNENYYNLSFFSSLHASLQAASGINLILR